MTSSLAPLRSVCFHCPIWPPLLMQHFYPTLAFKPLIPLLPILFLLLCFLTTNSCSCLSFYASCFLFPPVTPSGFFNGMLAVSEPGALNRYTFSHPIPSTLSASRNPILSHLSLSESLDSLLCNLIAPTPDLAFSLMMPCTLAAASSFSLGRVYPFLNFLLPPSPHLTPTLIM